MRGAMIVAALAVLAFVGWLMAETGTNGSAKAGGELVSFQVPAGENGVHLYIVDGSRHWFGVYKLDLETGDCRLTVARDFSADLELVQVGGKHHPSAQAVRTAVNRRQQD